MKTRVEIITTSAEAEVTRHHSWMGRINLIPQVGDSVALVKSSEEAIYYRNDPMK
jgi:hypothetical protein